MMKRLFLSGCMVLSLMAPVVHAQSDMSGREIIEKVNARFDGDQLTRNFTIELTDRRDVTRTEKTTGYRKYFGDEKRTVIFYTEPTNVRGTGFLTFDYPNPDIDDDQWLYLPALRKVRRISASDRGDYFLGTDLTYEEIKKEGKYEIEDYTYKTLGQDRVDGHEVIKVELTPIDEETAKELGYSKMVSYIDPEIWMARKVEFWDTNGNDLKTLENRKIEKIDDIWTVTEIFIKNHKTNHQTRMTFYDVDYEATVDDDVFTQQRLRRGLR